VAIAGILAFFGLLIAAYSLLAKHEKLFIRLRLSFIDKILIPVFIVIIFLSIIISDYFRDYDKEIIYHNLKFDLYLKFKLSFLISASAFLLLLMIIVYTFTKINLNRLKKRNLKLFTNLIKELLNRREYPTLISLINDEYKRLIKFSNKISWFICIKDKLLFFFRLKYDFELTPEDVDRLNEYFKETGENFKEKEYSRKEKVKLFLNNNKICNEFRHYVGKFIRKFTHEVRDRGQEGSRYLLNLLLTNRDFVSELIEIRPELGLKMFEKEFLFYHDYIDIFFYELIKNNKSILYYEVKNNQNLSFFHRYRLQEENLFMKFLFKDCRVAQRLEIYRGVGNYVKNYLEDLNKEEFDPYNYGYENFDDKKWESPIFVAIKLFDIMVSEAIYQGIRWHMWLFYFRIFTEEILNNFKAIPEVWEEYHEWNSKYAYLLYAMVSTLIDWIEIIKDERFSYKVELKNDDSHHENASVIKSCIICLIEVLDLISRSEKVPYKFKQYLTDMVFKLFFDLKTSSSKGTRRYGNVIFNLIKFYMFFPIKFNEAFYRLIKSTYDKFDKIPYIIGHKSNLAKILDKELEEYLDSII